MADTLLSVTKADLQPSGKTVTGASAHSNDPASPSFTARTATLGLSWVITTLALSPSAQTVDLIATGGATTLNVTAAAPTISAKTITSTATESATPAYPSLTPADVSLAYTSGGSYTLTVDSATPTIAAQDVDFEEVHEFDRAQVTIAAQDVTLNLPTILYVTAASLTPGSTSVTLNVTIRTDYAVPSFAAGSTDFPQVLYVDSATPTLTPADVSLTSGASYTLTADSTTVTAYGQNVTLTLGQPVLSVTAAAPSVSPQDIAFDLTGVAGSQSLTPASGSPVMAYTGPVTAQGIAPTPYTFPLTVGLTVGQATPTITARDVTLRVSITGYLAVEAVSLELDPQVVGMSRDGLSNQVDRIETIVAAAEVGLSGVSAEVSAIGSTGTIKCAA